MEDKINLLSVSKSNMIFSSLSIIGKILKGNFLVNQVRYTQKINGSFSGRTSKRVGGLTKKYEPLWGRSGGGNPDLFGQAIEGSRKKKVPTLMARPLRGGGGGKGRAIKEKRLFF